MTDVATTSFDVAGRDESGVGPLAGVRVIELGMLLAGPFTGRLLGDMGAEIVKVEPPGQPDPLREWGPTRYKGRSLWWPVQSRNKKCVTLNLRTEKGQELLLELVRRSDVLVENFRPGTLEHWNLGFERLSEVNPRIVLCRISGHGQTGPYAPRAGFASVAEAMGGIRHINGFPGEAPPRMHISLGDSLAGMFAAQGILAALYKRDAVGFERGQVVDVSLMESCFALLEGTVPEYDRLGIVRGPGGTGAEAHPERGHLRRDLGEHVSGGRTGDDELPAGHPHDVGAAVGKHPLHVAGRPRGLHPDTAGVRRELRRRAQLAVDRGRLGPRDRAVQRPILTAHLRPPTFRPIKWWACPAPCELEAHQSSGASRCF